MSGTADLLRTLEASPLTRSRADARHLMKHPALLRRRERSIEAAAVIGRILRHLGLPTDLPVARPARAPPLLATVDEAQTDPYETAP